MISPWRGREGQNGAGDASIAFPSGAVIRHRAGAMGTVLVSAKWLECMIPSPDRMPR
ncbi:MAG: hypothetical protein QE510_04930 [Verrucomicrobiota bacterium]|nr:hypothetical protein [Verrucomicrobiota bacterium]